MNRLHQLRTDCLCLSCQPALLYLVPACIGVPSLCAAIRGEFGELYKYSEEEDEEEEEAGDKKTSDETKKDD